MGPSTSDLIPCPHSMKQLTPAHISTSVFLLIASRSYTLQEQGVSLELRAGKSSDTTSVVFLKPRKDR